MEVDMLAAAVKALGILFDPSRLVYLIAGVVLGLVIGVIPGLGGLIGLSLLLPFTFDMDPYAALAMMIGLSAVVVTSDSIPAILFGVPGTVGCAATVIDGYPMARRGEAGRAFGAAFSASVMGGIFGALLLGLLVPVLRPLVLAVGSPELLAFCIFGLSLVAVLSGNAPLKGLVAACIGVLLACVGDDPQTGTLRWTFDTLYLWDGLAIVPLALGAFAIPELADLSITRSSIARDMHTATRASQIEGFKDVLKNWFLVIRSSGIGAGLGAVPGIGASVIDWIAYGHAARTERGAKESFGTGDVRGVIASEASNNAKEGGALVPTIAFGVPGSASMALILGAFLIHGIVPGPDMLTKQLDVTYTLVWSIAVANIFGAGICFAFANQLAKIALVRVTILVPLVIGVTYVGAFQGSKSWGDLYVLLGVGTICWIMKMLKWPRPPLVLGFVLGSLVERYMFISIERYNFEWLYRPVVLITLLFTVYGIMNPLVRTYLGRARSGAPRRRFGFARANLSPDFAFMVVLLAFFALAVATSAQWEFGARIVPQIISWAAIVFLVAMMALTLFTAPVPQPAATAASDSSGPMAFAPMNADKVDTGHFDLQTDYSEITPRQFWSRALGYFGWCIAFFIFAGLFGLLPGLLLYLIFNIRYGGDEPWGTTLKVSVITWIACYLIFHVGLNVPWPQALIGDFLPGFRSSGWLNLI